jgi:beta-glucosidase-like glycosyl hydrolase
MVSTGLFPYGRSQPRSALGSDFRGSGEDTYLGSEIAKAMVRGYQGKDLAANNTIMSCVKHYALYGASEAGRDYNTVDMSRHRMYNDYLPPYKAALMREQEVSWLPSMKSMYSGHSK